MKHVSGMYDSMNMTMNVMYDMITHKYIVPNIKIKCNEISEFIDQYLQADIRQDDEYSKWMFIHHYTRRKIPMATIDSIIAKYGNDEIEKVLVNNYNNVYDNLDIINKKDVKREKRDIIKKNLVMLILYNSIQHATYIY